MTSSLPPDATVLVVDDDASVRRVLKLSLERVGFRVLEAEHGVHALQVLDRERTRVDLMITDVVMPEMDGVTLVKTVMLRPAPPRVMFMSGLLHDAAMLNEVADRPAPFVQKPFDVNEIVQRVRLELGIG